MTTTDVRGLADEAAPSRSPHPPAFAFPVIDRVLRARPTRVLSAERETATIVRLRLERPAGYTFRAGQHAMLRLRSARGPEMRPLSLASAPEADHLEVATRIGDSAFKQALAALRPGDRVKVSRPMGGFGYDEQQPAVMVAGGLGITPVRSVLLSAAAAAAAAPVRVLFSNRTLEDAPFAPELAELAEQRDTLSITWVLTAPPAIPPTGAVLVGRISPDVLRRQLTEVPDAVFYVTGPPAMVRDVRSVLAASGLAAGRIRTVAQGLG